VILNLTVAGSGGNLKVLDAIRTNPDDRVSTARVVLCSPGGVNRLFAWESGVDGFMSAPFHIDEMLALVREVIERPESDRRTHRRVERDAARDGGRRDPTRAPGVVR
jgi:DNA-binding response OmpR family regulator